MIKNILKINGIKALTKTEQFDILGGTTIRLICRDGNVSSGEVPNCHCHNLPDGLYILIINDDNGNYRTYNLLGKEIVGA